MIQMKMPGVTVYQSTLMKTTSTLIETPDCLIVVDPGWLPDEIATIRRDVEIIRHERPLYIVYTHAHFDHILGAYAFKDAIAVASRRFIETDTQVALEEVQNFNDEYYIDSPVLFPEITHIIEESETTLTIGSTKLIFFLTPGHEETHLSFVVMPMNLLICGDYASDVEIPLIEHDSTEYLTTLELLESFIYEYEVKLLVPGHGHICDVRTDMIERLHHSYDYILGLRAGKESEWSASWQRTPFMHRLHEKNKRQVNKEHEARLARRQFD
ncbi:MULTISPECIES: MBL fold metallo-hydrolase [unclassified Exiguobacterium]|uniref:MBL fold metallo-hydrolase n=1 Tax=unclassified Exiguobacterium TaxID=2644629 RepID=UPI001BEB9390|nr:MULTISPECIES: MBL fold metallo-hydrolase [unclassified Exiguobacterium]